MKRKLIVLIVDDNEHYLQRMVDLLNEEEDISSIHTANNFDDAHLLLDKKPDLALLDIQLPGKSGIHLLKTIKDSSNDCEVFMVTNSTGDYYREQCKKLGALCFFDKTNDFELVPGVIRDFANDTTKTNCHDKLRTARN